MVTSRASQPPPPQSLDVPLHAALAAGRGGGEGRVWGLRGPGAALLLAGLVGQDRSAVQVVGAPGLSSVSAGPTTEKARQRAGPDRDAWGARAPLEKSRQAVPPAEGRGPSLTLKSEPAIARARRALPTLSLRVLGREGGGGCRPTRVGAASARRSDRGQASWQALWPSGGGWTVIQTTLSSPDSPATWLGCGARDPPPHLMFLSSDLVAQGVDAAGGTAGPVFGVQLMASTAARPRSKQCSGLYSGTLCHCYHRCAFAAKNTAAGAAHPRA